MDKKVKIIQRMIIAGVITFIVVKLILVFTSCNHKEPIEEERIPICFDTDVKPWDTVVIIQNFD